LRHAGGGLRPDVDARVEEQVFASRFEAFLGGHAGHHFGHSQGNPTPKKHTKTTELGCRWTGMFLFFTPCHMAGSKLPGIIPPLFQPFLWDGCVLFS
jgi:hypothetical protein